MEQQGGTSQFFFSPTFQCYTSPPFYRGLLLELDYVSWFVDQCKPYARAVIWKQLFALLDAKPLQCSRPFFPILRQWTESNTINLLAIELLYLAFATTLDCNPQLITSYFEPKGTAAPQPTGCSGASPLGPLLQPHMIPNVPAQKVPIYRPAAGVAVQGSSKEPRPLQPKPLPLAYPHQVSPKTVGGFPVPVPPGRRVAPAPAAPAYSTVSVASASPAPASFPAQSSPSVAPVVASASSAPTGPEVLQQLIDLQTWKHSLDEQPTPVKNTIISTLKVLPHFNEDKFNTQSLAQTIDSWGTDIMGNMQMISSLHSTISFLKSNGVIRFDKGEAGKRKATSPPPGEAAPKKVKA